MWNVYSDGASKGNPGPGGYGAVVIGPKGITEIGAYVANTTNNRMELTAVIEALKYIARNDNKAKAVIKTDSAYTINGATKWIFGWSKRGWYTATKEPVKNQDLWQELENLMSHVQVEFVKVPAHVGIFGNERADTIASDFAQAKPVELFSGTKAQYRKDYDLEVVNEKMATSRAKSKTKKTGKAYLYMSFLHGKVMRHKTWKECEARVKGKPAKFKKVYSEEEAVALEKEWIKMRR